MDISNTKKTTFRELMKSYREKKGWSQPEMAYKLSRSQSAYNKWETGKQNIPRRAIPKIVALLGIPESDTRQFIQDRQSYDPIVAMSYVEMIDAGISKEAIRAATDEIYDEYPLPRIEDMKGGSNDFGEQSKWDEIIDAHPDSFCMIKDHRSDKAVAFWHAISITDELYERAFGGENINKECSVEDACDFIIPKNHKLYFVDMFRRHLYNNSVVNRVILESFLTYLYQLAKTGHFIEAIVTHASSIEAEKVCSAIGFNFVCDHKFHRRYKHGSAGEVIPTKIYALNLSLGRTRLFCTDKDLENLYAEHFKVE